MNLKRVLKPSFFFRPDRPIKDISFRKFLCTEKTLQNVFFPEKKNLHFLENVLKWFRPDEPLIGFKNLLFRRRPFNGPLLGPNRPIKGFLSK